MVWLKPSSPENAQFGGQIRDPECLLVFNDSHPYGHWNCHPYDRPDCHPYYHPDCHPDCHPYYHPDCHQNVSNYPLSLTFLTQLVFEFPRLGWPSIQGGWRPSWLWVAWSWSITTRAIKNGDDFRSMNNNPKDRKKTQCKNAWFSREGQIRRFWRSGVNFVNYCWRYIHNEKNLHLCLLIIKGWTY